MAKVNICNVMVLDNPSSFVSPIQFEITFECLEDLKEDLEWKIVYVGSAESEDYDQVLDTVLVGPLVGGKHRFVFQADGPDAVKIPIGDVVGVTVVLLTCSYANQEFIRVGYYVNNEYADPELKENPPAVVNFEKLQRNLLATSPRVTRFRIDWNDGENGENVPPTGQPIEESNQMGFGSAADMMSKIAETSNSGLALSNGNSSKVVLSATSTDSNSMEVTGGARTEAEAMEM